jgi:murein DD-endopeptidase MepM/ murein hydrolase activator NlpD
VVSPAGVGAPVYSLTSGTVLRVAKGSRGSSGLSTIAIYDSATNKTVIYLHSNPVGIKAGDKVSVGQKIATMDWRGISKSSGAHTHVEVRNGQQKYAAKSVNDYKLDNSNPTSFWNNKGYTIK